MSGNSQRPPMKETDLAVELCVFIGDGSIDGAQSGGPFELRADTVCREHDGERKGVEKLRNGLIRVRR